MGVIVSFVWWEGVIFIVTYFVCMWSSRIIFTIILFKLIEGIQAKVKENIEGAISKFDKRGKSDEV